MSELILFKTETPKTPFAPVGSYAIFERNISDCIDLSKIKQTILAKEQSVIQQHTKEWKSLNRTSGWEDGATGLGNESLTSRSPFYNLVNWRGMAPLRTAIRQTHDQFLTALKKNQKEIQEAIYIQCWANVMREGQQVKRHAHYTNRYCYLGGHLCLAAKNTATYYVDPYTRTVFSSKNEPGKITLFPNWIEHYTDTVVGDEYRMTIAFDLLNKVGYEEDIFDAMKSHWRKL